MIFDKIENLSAYRALLPEIAEILRYLDETDVSSLSAGKHDIGGGMTVAVNCYAPKDSALFEAHRKYIDLQYMISGSEDMICAQLGGCSEGGEYSDETDAQFFAHAEHRTTLTANPGNFTLFFPWDAHKPGQINEYGAQAVCKLVFKLPVPEYRDEAYLCQIMKQIEMPENACTAILNAYHAVGNALADLTDRYFDGENVDADIHEIAGAAGITPELGNLTAYLLFGRRTWESYREKGIARDIYVTSMTDFTVWEKVCEKKLGHPGLLECGWLSCTLREGLYRLGRLQFQPASFPEESAVIEGVELHKGDPVLYIHIPEGSPLTKEARLDAYQRAAAFFKDYPRASDGSLVFVCESWLLYPAHREFLQKGSNIVSFMDDFRLLASDEEIGNYHNMWRVFGFPKTGIENLDALPEDTGMQRTYKKHLKETNATGGGCGVFLFDGVTYKK